jgi:tellurite methyltransferase
MADWNERYKRGEHADEKPDAIVLRFASSLAPGRALDLACGAGRHAIWLAEQGWSVTAVDRSTEAIDILKQRASARGVVVDARFADLERREFLIEAESFDLIVVCKYLQRNFFPAIRQGIRIGGMAIAVIAMVDNDPSIKPMNPAFLLEPGELRREFDGWRIVWDFEGKPENERWRSRAEIVAVRCAS